MTLIPTFYPLADVADHFEEKMLTRAIKELVIRLRGWHIHVEIDSSAGEPKNIPRVVLWNLKILFAESRIEVNPGYDMDPESSHVNDSVYVDVQCYAEDVRRLIESTYPVKRGRPEKYNWPVIELHARQVGRGWASSQSKYLTHIQDLIEQWSGQRPDISTVKRHLASVFNEEQAIKRAGA